MYRGVRWHTTQQMMSEKSGPLESGSREARFVLIDEQGVQRGGADTLADARERREELDTEREVSVVHERREVVPDDIDGVSGDDWNWKRKHRVSIGDETPDSSFLHIAHPTSAFGGPQTATFTRKQAAELHHALGLVLTGKDPEPRTDGGVEPDADDAADALHVLNSLEPDGEDRVREDVLPRILTFLGDAEPEDVPEYRELPEDAGKWTTAASLALAFAGREPATDPDVRVFREWVDSHDTTEPYDVKTIRVHEPERGRYVYVMVNRLDGRNHALGDMGFTGVYFQFSVMSQSADFRLTRLSAYEIKRDHPVEWFPDSNAYSLISGLDSGSVDWNELADGDQLTPEDVAELTEDGGEDGE